jgi:AcrR family transcriptional regulator
MRHLSHMKKETPKLGRAEQKAKTRTRILDEARGLLQKEKDITLEEVAEKAGISRATIYRYYSNVDLLTMEASLEIYHKTPEELYEEVKEKSLEERLLYIQKHYNNFAQENETVFRRYLSAVLAESISSKEKLRGARRLKSLNKALQSFEKDFEKNDLEKLKNSAAVLMGIDALVVCKDVCDLDNQKANDTLAWALEMILKGMKA